MNVMDGFGQMSGLFINNAKSSIYEDGKGTLLIQGSAAEVGMEVGVLPIRYLGLPLTNQALTKVDYEPLLDKIRKTLLGWTNKTLMLAVCSCFSQSFLVWLIFGPLLSFCLWNVWM